MSELNPPHLADYLTQVLLPIQIKPTENMKNIYATFNSPDDAQKAAGALLDHGVNADNISIVFPEVDKATWQLGGTGGVEHAEENAKHGISTTTVGDAQAGAAKGAGIGLAAGVAAALAAVFVPGVGLVLGGGALALAIGGMAGSSAAGAIAGGVTGFLKDQGVPDHLSTEYEHVIRSGGALITVSPTDEEVYRSEIQDILAKYGGNVSSFLPIEEGELMLPHDPVIMPAPADRIL